MTDEILGNYVNAVNSSGAAASPHTSLILACFKVEKYLPHFLASLDAQIAEHSGYELIFVIDGCPESSEAVVRDWADRTDYAVRILTKANGGVASARNAGLDWATGTWVSSPDPDDRLAPDYLSEIERAIVQFPNEAMFVGRIRLRSAAGSALVHPLDNKFMDESIRVVDLMTTPDQIQTLGGVVFFSRDRICELGLQHHVGLPTASDADFIMRYQLYNQARFVLVPTATYIYQRRVDDSSIVKTQEQNIERFRVVFGETHRSLLELAGRECPQWLANTLLYFTFYLFRRNLRVDSPVYDTNVEALEDIHLELQENLRRIGIAHIQRFRLFEVPIEIRMAWLAAAAPDALSSPVEVLRHDQGSHEWFVCFYSPSRAIPAGLEAIGKATIVFEHKLRAIEFLDHGWTYQHILRVHGTDGERPRFTSEDEFQWELEGEAHTAREIRRALGQARVSLPGVMHDTFRARGATMRSSAIRVVRSLSLGLSRVVGHAKQYANAVVLDEGPHNRDVLMSPLEQAFSELGLVNPGLNIWHIVDQTGNSPATGAKTVLRGSLRHFILMKQARTLVIDRFDQSTQEPFPRNTLPRSWHIVYAPRMTPGKREYRVLNGLAIDTILAASDRECEFYGKDGGYYRLLRSQIAYVPDYRDGPTTVMQQSLLRMLEMTAH